MSDETKGTAKGGIRSTEAKPFGSDSEANASQTSSASLVNPDPKPIPRAVGELDETVTGFSEAGMDVVESDGQTVVTLFDKERLRAIVEALHCHVGVLRGLIARREGEFSTNPSSLQFELQALKKGKLRAEILLEELEGGL